MLRKKSFTPPPVKPIYLPRPCTQERGLERGWRVVLGYLSPKPRALARGAGFTLVEVVIAMVLLSSVTAGLFASFVASHRYVHHSKPRLLAANLASQILEELYAEVRQDTWNDDTKNFLACPGASYPCSKTNISPCKVPTGHPLEQFSPTTVTCEIATPFASEPTRRVKVTVNWTEP